MSTAEKKIGAARLRKGVVIKNRMEKTVIVEVVRQVRHPRYHKFIKRRARFVAHDAENACNIGDTVLMEESRPLSKTKRWRIKEITQRAESV